MSDKAFRVALYSADDQLVKSSIARPIWRNPDSRQVADMVARSADAGCTYYAGIVAVWADLTICPPADLTGAVQPDAVRAFGPDHLPVPAYRWEPAQDWAIDLVPAS